MSKRSRSGLKYVLALTTAGAAINIMSGGIVAAFAQGGEISADEATQDVVVVTARKREESLQEVPLAISAFSGDEIDKAGFRGLEDLSLQVAGLQYHDQGGQRPGRFNSAIRFRGMNVNSTVPTFQLGSLFIDGNFVLGSTHSIPIVDLERVEVIKGPQSAYFGRNTFGGAVNYVTRKPSLDKVGVRVEASAATYQELDVTASVEGPIIKDVLGLRVGARFYNAGGMFTASDGGDLGEESTNAVWGTLYAKPSDNFSAQFRAFYSRDDDGPPAGGFIDGATNSTCNGQTFTTNAGETVVPVNWFCDGMVPSQGDAISMLGGTKIINGITTLTPSIETELGIEGFLVNGLVNSPFPDEFSGIPKVEKIGLIREIHRYSANFDYEFDNGMSVAVQGGYNEVKANWIRDQALSGIAQNFSRDPQSQEDFSVEGRIVSAQDGRFRWLAGVNYYEQEFLNGGTGGTAVIYCGDTLLGDPAIGAGCNPSFGPFLFGNSLNSSDEVKTLGIFGSLSFDITDQITLDFEGRYQRDRLDREGVDIDSNTFLPRVILQYQVNNTNLYASFAQGVLPGESNPFVINADAQELAQYEAQFGNTISDVLPEEKLNSYEIGWKQSLFDNRMHIAVAAYYGEWQNQKSRVVATIQETCDAITTTIPGCGPGDNTLVGDPASAADGSPVFTPRNTTVTGSGKIYGVEVEGDARITDNWTANFTAALAESEFTDFESRFITFYSNFSNVKGNSHARYPRWTSSISSTYQHALTEDWDWFVRGDWVYYGKTFVSVANIAQCDDYNLFHARVGIERDELRVEAFVRNAFDNNDWSACARNTNFSVPVDFTYFSLYQGASVSPQDRRQFGVKASYRF